MLTKYDPDNTPCLEYEEMRIYLGLDTADPDKVENECRAAINKYYLDYPILSSVPYKGYNAEEYSQCEEKKELEKWLEDYIPATVGPTAGFNYTEITDTIRKDPDISDNSMNDIERRYADICGPFKAECDAEIENENTCP